MLPIFRGAATALLTPFRPDGSIDLPAWDRLLERQLDAGIAALVVCGTTGEAATLTQDERLTLLRRAKQAVPCRKIDAPVRPERGEERRGGAPKDRQHSDHLRVILCRTACRGEIPVLQFSGRNGIIRH
jgi:hypothetical protein